MKSAKALTPEAMCAEVNLTAKALGNLRDMAKLLGHKHRVENADDVTNLLEKLDLYRQYARKLRGKMYNTGIGRKALEDAKSVEGASRKVDVKAIAKVAANKPPPAMGFPRAPVGIKNTIANVENDTGLTPSGIGTPFPGTKVTTMTIPAAQPSYQPGGVGGTVNTAQFSPAAPQAPKPTPPPVVNTTGVSVGVETPAPKPQQPVQPQQPAQPAPPAQPALPAPPVQPAPPKQPAPVAPPAAPVQQAAPRARTPRRVIPRGKSSVPGAMPHVDPNAPSYIRYRGAGSDVTFDRTAQNQSQADGSGVNAPMFSPEGDDSVGMQLARGGVGVSGPAGVSDEQRAALSEARQNAINEMQSQSNRQGATADTNAIAAYGTPKGQIVRHQQMGGKSTTAYNPRANNSVFAGYQAANRQVATNKANAAAAKQRAANSPAALAAKRRQLSADYVTNGNGYDSFASYGRKAGSAYLWALMNKQANLPAPSVSPPAPVAPQAPQSAPATAWSNTMLMAGQQAPTAPEAAPEAPQPQNVAPEAPQAAPGAPQPASGTSDHFNYLMQNHKGKLDPSKLVAPTSEVDWDSYTRQMYTDPDVQSYAINKLSSNPSAANHPDLAPRIATVRALHEAKDPSYSKEMANLIFDVTRGKYQGADLGLSPATQQASIFNPTQPKAHVPPGTVQERPMPGGAAMLTEGGQNEIRDAIGDRAGNAAVQKVTDTVSSAFKHNKLSDLSKKLGMPEVASPEAEIEYQRAKASGDLGTMVDLSLKTVADGAVAKVKSTAENAVNSTPLGQMGQQIQGMISGATPGNFKEFLTKQIPGDISTVIAAIKGGGKDIPWTKLLPTILLLGGSATGIGSLLGGSNLGSIVGLIMAAVGLLMGMSNQGNKPQETNNASPAAPQAGMVPA